MHISFSQSLFLLTNLTSHRVCFESFLKTHYSSPPSRYPCLKTKCFVCLFVEHTWTQKNIIYAFLDYTSKQKWFRFNSLFQRNSANHNPIVLDWAVIIFFMLIESIHRIFMTSYYLTRQDILLCPSVKCFESSIQSLNRVIVANT